MPAIKGLGQPGDWGGGGALARDFPGYHKSDPGYFQPNLRGYKSQRTF